MSKPVPFSGESSPQPNSAAGDETEAMANPQFALLAILTGAGAGVAAGLLMKLLRLAQHLSYNYQGGTFLSGVEHSPPVRRVVVLALAGLLGGVVLYLVQRISGKESKTLPEAVWCKAGEMNAVPTLTRAVLSIVVVGMGVSLGREGAMKQAGGALGTKFADWFRLTPEQRHLLVACGAGAGMGAAYNVPLGGALFAAEVLLGSLTLPTVIPTLTASLAATAVSWLLLPNQPTYKVAVMATTPSMIAWSVVAAPILGVCAYAYIRGIGWAGKHKPRGMLKTILPIAVFAVIGAAAMKLPELLGNGKNVVQLAYDDQMSLGLTAMLLLARPLATISSLRTGVPGGLFTPTMTFGALLGEALGHGWSRLWPGSDLGAFAILGSGAMLSAATQGPVSSVIFVLELTHHGQSLMVPLMIAVAGATFTSRLLGPQSIYSIRVS